MTEDGNQKTAQTKLTKMIDGKQNAQVVRRIKVAKNWRENQVLRLQASAQLIGWPNDKAGDHGAQMWSLSFDAIFLIFLYNL